MLTWLMALALLRPEPPALPHHLWMEAETFGPLKGANFSFMQTEKQTKDSWSVAGPDAAASWTQGGESEWMSVAARADEPDELVISRPVEVPEAGRYTLWVRYADYRGKEESFGVRVRQGAAVPAHVFGKDPVVDELDPMKLLWDWSFAWDRAEMELVKGPATVEIYTNGPTGARRCVDCLCLTTDLNYRPTGRRKPDFAAWRLMREMAKEMRSADAWPARSAVEQSLPAAWKVSTSPPAFLWNVGTPWLEELKKPQAERIDTPFGLDPPLLKDWLAAYKGKLVPVYGSRLSGPVWHIPLYPQVFVTGSPFLAWLDSHPDSPFAILLNYGEPSWPANADRKAMLANLGKYAARFTGYVAGENIAYANVDNAELERRVRAARSRGDVLNALRELHTNATRAKFSDYSGSPVSDAEAWSPVISCLSANMEAMCHALCAWGVKRIGHENTGNSPTLARRLAFLRGAARQFGAKLVDYQSCNLGDSATMFSREHYFYPGSSRYVIDNQYDVWAGAGMNWLLKDYVLWHLAGVDAFYNEQGIDLFWKPGGGVAGDDFPVQLSPKGKVAEAAIRLAENHPRGTQHTPVAFLLDEAHGWAQERFEPGALGMNPSQNPAILTPGRHEASLRGWFDVAYYPAPETQNEPASGVRQTYVNGVFGDIFDVIVTAPKRTAILPTYRTIITAGEVPISEEWGKALIGFVRNGGTLVVCADRLAGEGVKMLRLPAMGSVREAASFTWVTGTWVTGGRTIASNLFRFHPLPASYGRSLATTADGAIIAAERREGKGRLIVIGVPLGLGIDDQPVPLLGLVMRYVTDALVPVRVSGDVEWTLNGLEDGGWLVGLLNNRGVIKPQHGVLPTDHAEAQIVTLRFPLPVAESEEWMTEKPVAWRSTERRSEATITVPAGAVRLVAIRPRK